MIAISIGAAAIVLLWRAAPQIFSGLAVAGRTLDAPPRPPTFELVADVPVGKVFVARLEGGTNGVLLPALLVELWLDRPFDLGLAAQGERDLGKVFWLREHLVPIGDEPERTDALLPRWLLERVPTAYHITDDRITAVLDALTEEPEAAHHVADMTALARVLDERRSHVPPARALVPWVPAIERTATEIGWRVFACPLGVEGWVGDPPARLFVRLHFVRGFKRSPLTMRVRPAPGSTIDLAASVDPERNPRRVALLASLAAWGSLRFADRGFDLAFHQLPSPDMLREILLQTHTGLGSLGRELHRGP